MRTVYVRPRRSRRFRRTRSTRVVGRTVRLGALATLRPLRRTVVRTLTRRFERRRRVSVRPFRRAEVRFSCSFGGRGCPPGGGMVGGGVVPPPGPGGRLGHRAVGRLDELDDRAAETVVRRCGPVVVGDHAHVGALGLDVGPVEGEVHLVCRRDGRRIAADLEGRPVIRLVVGRRVAHDPCLEVEGRDRRLGREADDLDPVASRLRVRQLNPLVRRWDRRDRRSAR